jgi:Rod binding domain-containing protein
VTGPLPVALPPAGPDEGRLARLRSLPESEARRAAARELETAFLAQLLGALRKTVPDSDFLPRSPSRAVYEGAFDRAVAESLAARDPLGLVKILGEEPKEPSPPCR